MKTRSAVLAAVVLVAGVLAAAQKDRAPVYKSPEAVFAAAEAAKKKGDFKGFFDCLSPASQKRLAADMAYNGLTLKADVESGRAPARFKDKIKPIVKLMEKHGLTEAATKKIMRDAGRDRVKATRALSGVVKDPETFAVRFMAAMEKFSGEKPGKDQPKARLTNVKIDGDRARGTVVVAVDDTTHKESIAFTRVGGGWRIVLPEPKEPEKPKDRREK
jgi:hypothetical protein